MQSPCIASSASVKLLPTAPTRLRGQSIWNWNCEYIGSTGRFKTVKKILMLILGALFASTAFAADGKPVSYKSGDETVQAMLYTPAGKRPSPAIIVIHEYWGLNDWVKEQ